MAGDGFGEFKAKLNLSAQGLIISVKGSRGRQFTEKPQENINGWREEAMRVIQGMPPTKDEKFIRHLGDSELSTTGCMSTARMYF